MSRAGRFLICEQESGFSQIGNFAKIEIARRAGRQRGEKKCQREEVEKKDVPISAPLLSSFFLLPCSCRAVGERPTRIKLNKDQTLS
jgi:hypothetical protein